MMAVAKEVVSDTRIFARQPFLGGFSGFPIKIMVRIEHGNPQQLGYQHHAEGQRDVTGVGGDIDRDQQRNLVIDQVAAQAPGNRDRLAEYFLGQRFQIPGCSVLALL